VCQLHFLLHRQPFELSSHTNSKLLASDDRTADVRRRKSSSILLHTFKSRQGGGQALLEDNSSYKIQSDAERHHYNTRPKFGQCLDLVNHLLCKFVVYIHCFHRLFPCNALIPRAIMSFGFSVGDFIAVGELALKVCWIVFSDNMQLVNSRIIQLLRAMALQRKTGLCPMDVKTQAY
jgi:hypothetical protein